jgi:hypothetical protein
MMLKGHDSITAAGRATHLRAGRRPCPRASFGLNTSPNTPIHSGMQSAGFRIRGIEYAQQQVLNYSLGMR